MNLNENESMKHSMKIFKFTLNAGFSKQSFLNYYSTEVKANQPYWTFTQNFSNIKYIKRILMNTFLAV